MLLGILLVIFTCIANLGLGLFVLLRNPKLRSSIYFFCITISISLWTLSNYLTESASIPITFNRLFNRLAYLFGYLCLVFIALFCFNFPKKYLLQSHRKVIVFITLLVLFAGLTLTDWVAGTVSTDARGLHFTSGPLIITYGVVLLILLGMGLVRLTKTMLRSPPRTRNQIRFIMAGFLLSVVLGILMNVAIPALVASFETAKFGPLLTVFVVASTAYAIVKYGLFDIRLVVARAVTYVFVLGSLAFGYSFLVFMITRLLLHREVGLTGSQQAVNIPVTLFLALSFSGLKRTFDRITNKYFYQDAYDAQDFLDKLSKVLVSTIEMQPLLASTSRIIGDTLKAEFCVFGIKATDSQPRRLIGTIEVHFDEDDVAKVREFTAQSPVKVIVTDDITDEFVKTRAALRRNNVAVMARLTNNPAMAKQGYGYLVLGDKRSGSPYSQQDIKIIEIIADELTIAVQNALRFEEIENFNIKLREEVIKATRELRHANERLKELDQTKDDFISMASHQLRTPLTSVKGYVSMVLEGDAGKTSPMQRKLLEQAFISSQRMVYLIADLLNVSRLRTGKFIIEPQPTDLSEVIESEAAQLRDIAEARGLTLTYKRPKNFPVLMLDESKIRQVIMNFTDNAIYYTPTGGHITLNLFDKPDMVEFTVVDNGIGVPKNEQHRLFTKFYRAANAKRARPDGTGLGLFMAKKVVAAQGGAIIFSSQEGKGSTFGFTFPKIKLSTEAQPHAHGKAHTTMDKT